MSFILIKRLMLGNLKCNIVNNSKEIRGHAIFLQFYLSLRKERFYEKNQRKTSY